MKKQTRKILNKLLLFIFVVGALSATAFFATSKAYAYWKGSSSVPEEKTESVLAQLGSWTLMPFADKKYQVDPEYEGNVIHFAPVQYDVKEGDIVIKDGVMYIATEPIDKDSYYADPDNRSNFYLITMKYRKDGNEYAGINKYYVDDVVTYQGKTYRWTNILRPHRPNMPTEGPPLGDNEANFWEEIHPYECVKYWARYRIYFEDEIVYWNGSWYKAEIDDNGINAMKEPSRNSKLWTVVKDYNSRTNYEKDTIVRTEADGYSYFYKAKVNNRGQNPATSPDSWELIETYLN